MWQKIFVFKEYIQRHVLRAVKYLKKILWGILYTSNIKMYFYVLYPTI